jgi:hypothetical protein
VTGGSAFDDIYRQAQARCIVFVAIESQGQRWTVKADTLTAGSGHAVHAGVGDAARDAVRDQSDSPRTPSSSRTRRWSLAHTLAFVHSVKRRCAVAPDGPNDADANCCHVQPDVATNTIAASTYRSP